MMITESLKNFSFRDLEFLSPALGGDPMDRIFDLVSDEVAEWLGLAQTV